MKPHFRHVALIGKYQTPVTGAAAESSRQVLENIALFLVSQGCKVTLEADTAAAARLPQYDALDADAIGEQCDVGLVVGGDGTMLSIGRKLARHGTPLIGINQGRLGFITDIPLGNYRTTLPPMLRGEYEEDHRPLMHARVIREGTCVFDAFAMNDVVVNRGATSGMVELRVEVGGHFVSNQRADGLIIASPTGSTAYALSAGGPMLHPSIPGWVLVPIAPHTLSNRPIVLADATEIAIEVVGGRDISANFDMQSLASLLHGDRILVTRSEYCVRFLHPRGWSYFDTLRKKLRWNEGGS
ncbi:NAD kinase [Acidovorax sp. SRB_14]|uniref:NAD kinase n=1 Tax=unclassified Acidovorax TaxID=2684926 RepID=UPI00145DC1CD|nr:MULTISPECIES: NAD kinase [unclassified Acidovorax]NMM75578.1 NAD kinase [Acidovorax sp. SRB_24]NMM76806.1 NAD kinase [Acidovorax sp. SRB_24]NMM79989.1 NAD kinase [Acidovorax sp. SRB_14]